MSEKAWLSDEVFDLAWEEAYGRKALDERSPEAAFAMGAEWGAGWAFAIIGMAEAIRWQGLCDWCENTATHFHQHEQLCGTCDERY